MKAKFKYEYVKEFIESHGYKLLSKEYKGINKELSVSCKCGIIWNVSFSSLKYAFPCKNCSDRKQRKRISGYDAVEKFVEIDSESDCLLITSRNDFVDSSQVIEFKCPCGNIFNTKFIYFYHDNVRTCKECTKKRVSGENHCHWTGGSSLRDKIKITPEYKEWREKVLERDNFACQVCGETEKNKLEVHHIENFSEHLDIATDVSNGITLCGNCHDFSQYGSFHWVYGTRNNNKKQLEEYIERYRRGAFQVCQLANLIK